MHGTVQHFASGAERRNKHKYRKANERGKERQ
jgi:hypothetical protein